MGQSLGGGAVPLCGQGGLGLCPRLGCHGLASPEWRPGFILHFLTCLCLAMIAAHLINIPACWYLNECTADSLHILRTAITCPKLSFCAIPWLFGLEMYVSFSHFMHHVAIALCVVSAEAWSGGLHTAAQVAEAPQAGPHQALTPSPGSPCPFPQTISSCSSHNFN